MAVSVGLLAVAMALTEAVARMLFAQWVYLIGIRVYRNEQAASNPTAAGLVAPATAVSLWQQIRAAHDMMAELEYYLKHCGLAQNLEARSESGSSQP